MKRHEATQEEIEHMEKLQKETIERMKAYRELDKVVEKNDEPMDLQILNELKSVNSNLDTLNKSIRTLINISLSDPYTYQH